MREPRVADDPPGDRREHHGHDRHGQGGQAGLQRREAPHVLEVERVEEEEAAERGEGGHGDDGRAGERHRPEEAQVDERLVAPPLPRDQPDEGRQRDGERGHDDRRGPAPVRRLDDAVGQRGQQHDDEHLPDAVDPAWLRCPRLGDEPEGQHDGGQSDREVDPEDGTPPHRGRRARRRSPGRAPCSRRPPPPTRRPPGPVPSGSVKVLVMIDIATGLSIDPPMAWTMRKTTSVVWSGARLHSSEPMEKIDQSRHEGPLAPETVRGRTREHEQAGEHQRVGVHRPLEPGHRGAEVPPDGGQRHVHDRHVEPDDEQAHRADQQHPDAPAPAQLDMVAMIVVRTITVKYIITILGEGRSVSRRWDNGGSGACPGSVGLPGARPAAGTEPCPPRPPRRPAEGLPPDARRVVITPLTCPAAARWPTPCTATRRARRPELSRRTGERSRRQPGRRDQPETSGSA